MITVLARFEMQKGKELQATDAIKKMAQDVHDLEPGCLMYMVTRGQVNAQEIYVYEVYADEGAFQAHRKTDHLRALQKVFDETLDRSSFNVEVLNTVAGFIRHQVASD